MEGIGSRTGRPSSRYVSAPVSIRQVRRWQKHGSISHLRLLRPLITIVTPPVLMVAATTTTCYTNSPVDSCSGRSVRRRLGIRSGRETEAEATYESAAQVWGFWLCFRFCIIESCSTNWNTSKFSLNSCFALQTYLLMSREGCRVSR
ncbi:hypothetical protein R6Q59_031105 [Mikania micrantha]